MLCWLGGWHVWLNHIPTTLRSRVAAAAGKGKSNRAIADLFGISPSAVSKWSQRYRATGSSDAKQMGGHRRAILTDEREWLHGRISEPDSDVTIRGLLVERASAKKILSFQSVTVRSVART